MLEKAFLQFINMSYIGSIVILFIIEANFLSYKLLDPESLEEIDKIGDRTKIEIAVEMHVVWRKEAFNTPNNTTTRFIIFSKYQNGWKIEGIGTGH